MLEMQRCLLLASFEHVTRPPALGMIYGLNGRRQTISPMLHHRITFLQGWSDILYDEGRMLQPLKAIHMEQICELLLGLLVI